MIEKLGITTVGQTDIPIKGYTTNYYGLHKIELSPTNIVNISGSKISSTSGPVDMEFTTPTLLSDEHKIFWWANIGLYNLFYECFPHLLAALKEHDNPIVIINAVNMGNDVNSAYFQFMLNSLTDIGIRYELYTNKHIIFANNFSVISTFLTTSKLINDLKKHFSKYIENKNVKPFRKVYLSRNHIGVRDYYWIKDGLSSKNDHRLNDPEKLEKFLKDAGFEVFVPEDRFLSFKEQINYMYEVETLVSVSSSGIANALFMQPKTSIVEFMTTYPLGMIDGNFSAVPNSVEGREDIHHLYHALTYLNNTCYFALPNYTRNSDDIIDTINNNKYFRNIILGG